MNTKLYHGNKFQYLSEAKNIPENAEYYDKAKWYRIIKWSNSKFINITMFMQRVWDFWEHADPLRRNHEMTSFQKTRVGQNKISIKTY